MDQRCVRLELGASDKEGAIRELVQLLADAGKISDVELCLSEVLAREKISSTGIGMGIAIPHRLIAGVGEIMMAVGRKSKGIPFDSVDGKPAHLFFLIIGQQGQINEYLKVLGKLSRYLNDRSFFEALMKVKAPDEVIGLVKDRENLV
jgi:PTS system fructose-specific IIC component